jgi:hypothetical protein
MLFGEQLGLWKGVDKGEADVEIEVEDGVREDVKVARGATDVMMVVVLVVVATEAVMWCLGWSFNSAREVEV